MEIAFVGERLSAMKLHMPHCARSSRQRRVAVLVPQMRKLHCRAFGAKELSQQHPAVGTGYMYAVKGSSVSCIHGEMADAENTNASATRHGALQQRTVCFSIEAGGYPRFTLAEWTTAAGLAVVSAHLNHKLLSPRF